MEDIEQVIGHIYEAGALPELWIDMMETIASQIGAIGGNIIVSSPFGLKLTSSPSIAEVAREFDELGWNEQNTRVGRLLDRANHPGFLTDADLHSPEEIATLPMYTQFLTPRGADAGAATVIAGARHDAIMIAFEGFRDKHAAWEAVPTLNKLRPHFARAAVLSSRVQASRASTLVDALDATGTPIALLDAKGRILHASKTFVGAMGDVFVDSPRRLRLTDLEADSRLEQALVQRAATGSGTSIAVRNQDNLGIAVLHLIPARRDARDLFNRVESFAVIAQPGNDTLPSIDIIASLFDLTPAEARVARGLAQGHSLEELAVALSVTQATVRSHLKRIFAKTSTKRQSELALLVAGFR